MGTPEFFEHLDLNDPQMKLTDIFDLTLIQACPNLIEVKRREVVYAESFHEQTIIILVRSSFSQKQSEALFHLTSRFYRPLPSISLQNKTGPKINANYLHL